MKNSEGKKKKHILLKVFLVLVLILIVGCAGLYIWQKDNIDSAIVGMQYSQEDIAEKISQSKQSTEQALVKYNLPIQRDFTLEEEEKIRKGEMTVEEAMANIMAESTGDASTSSAGQEENKEDSSSDTGADASVQEDTKAPSKEDEIIGRYVTQVYSLKAYYIGQLGSVESQLRAEYVASGKDKSKISSIVSSHLGEISSMESECDSRISSLLSSMESELNAINADTSIVSTIEEAYINEKSLRKSYYLSQYK